MTKFFLYLGISRNVRRSLVSRLLLAPREYKRGNGVRHQSADLYFGPGYSDSAAAQPYPSQRRARDQTEQGRDYSGARTSVAADQCECEFPMDRSKPDWRARARQHEYVVGIYARRGPAAASLMEGLPSQVGDARTPLAAVTPSPIRNVEQSDISYAISVTGTQLIFNGTTFNQIRGTFFQRDSAYFAFRNVLDQLIATVKTQFYQIIVNRDLVQRKRGKRPLVGGSIEGSAKPV